MITKFKIYEKLHLEDIKLDIENSDKKMLEEIIDKLSIVIQKRVKRNLRIIKISGSMNIQQLNKMEKTLTTSLIINMSNKDELKIKYIYDESVNSEPIGEIDLKINDKTIYHIKRKDFTPDKWIDKISDEYKKYLKSKKWTIK